MAKTSTVAILLTLICTILIATGQLFFKLGSEKIFGFLSFFNLLVIFGLFFYAIGAVIYIFALKRGEVSVIAPLMALNYVWVTLFSMFILKETINGLRFLGIASVVIGVVIIGVSGKYDV